MPAESIGQILLQLVVDNKAFAEGLKNSLQLLQVANTQFKDLTDFKIPAPDLEALDLQLELGEKRLQDFTAAGQALKSDPPTLPAEVPESHDEHTRKVQDGEKALRQFWREQKFQDRVSRDAREALLGATGAVATFTVGNSVASKAVKQFDESLLSGLAAQNQMEFALFSLGQVGSKLPGMFGTIATSVGAMAGPIAITVGVGALLINFFQRSNEEAKKAAEEGLKQYREELGKLSEPQRLQLATNLKAEVEKIKAQLGEIELARRAIATPSPETGAVETSRALTAKEAELKRALEQRLGILEQIQAATEVDLEMEKARLSLQRESDTVLQNVLTTVQDQDLAIKRLRTEIETRVDLEKQTALTVEQIRARTDELNRIERERAENLKSSLDLAKDLAVLREAELQLGRTNVDGVINALVAQRALTTDKKEQADIDLKILQLQQRQAADAVAVAEARRRLGAGSTEELLKALEAEKALKTETKEKLAIEERIRAVRVEQVEQRTVEAERARRLGAITSDQLIEQYRRQLAITTDVSKRHTIEDKITQELRSQTDELERQRQLREEFNQKLQELTLIGINNEFESRRVAEQQRFEREKKSIEEKYAIIGVFEDGQTRLSEEGEKLLFELKKSNMRVLHQLGVDLDRVRREIQQTIDGESEQSQIAAIYDRYEQEAALARQVYTDKNELDVVLTALEKARDREVANLQLANTQRVLGAAQTIVGNIVSVARNLTEPAEGFLANLEKALQVAQAIVATVQAINLIGSIFGFSRGGPVPVMFAATGMQIPGGSYVVRKSAVDENRPILEALGAKEVTGGIPGKDSVLARVDGGGFVAMMPGEMVVAPQFAPIAKAINEGKLRMKASGGVVSGMEGLASMLREYQEQGLIPGTVRLPASVVEALQLNLTGGVSRSEFAELVNEVRKTNQKLDGLTGETAGLANRLKFPDSIPAIIDREELRRGINDIERYESIKRL